MRALAEKVIAMCRTLATFTEEPGRTTRTFLSPPMGDVHRLLGAWMRELGMSVRVDAAGNLRGVGPRGGTVIASHLDTVPNAGAFDGILGVVLAIALFEASADPSIEVIGFSDEEGVRFGIPFIGSRALVGSLDPPTALKVGLDPGQLSQPLLDPGTRAYLEFHIEQGPVLEHLDLPLGIVESIAGQSRLTLTFEGQANHAGTTPMALRKDALTAAAEWIAVVEKSKNVVATVGALHVLPNATNVIPGTVRASLDVRHACDDHRRSAVEHLIHSAQGICARRGIGLTIEHQLNQPAVPMDSGLTNKLAAAVRSAGYPVHRMPSGAGHDAMVVAPHLPAAMLFLRSPGGISHHPDETVLLNDVAAALETGLAFLHA
jgi:allantoate deiminase